MAPEHGTARRSTWRDGGQRSRNVQISIHLTEIIVVQGRLGNSHLCFAKIKHNVVLVEKDITKYPFLIAKAVCMAVRTGMDTS